MQNSRWFERLALSLEIWKPTQLSWLFVFTFQTAYPRGQGNLVPVHRVSGNVSFQGG